jgi:hypothetical protein
MAHRHGRECLELADGHGGHPTLTALLHDKPSGGNRRAGHHRFQRLDQIDLFALIAE